MKFLLLTYIGNTSNLHRWPGHVFVNLLSFWSIKTSLFASVCFDLHHAIKNRENQVGLMYKYVNVTKIQFILCWNIHWNMRLAKTRNLKKIASYFRDCIEYHVQNQNQFTSYHYSYVYSFARKWAEQFEMMFIQQEICRRTFMQATLYALWS